LTPAENPTVGLAAKVMPEGRLKVTKLPVVSVPAVVISRTVVPLRVALPVEVS